ncbi:Pathogenesis-related protein 1C [Cytospora mali]|uniref:Pathogenesis-related protein 1C n=1 Tax=Cytospora mali TaxID=578113 RepID=A0A194W7E1_CYTMA|nr:Pathogenesis-related protein 1C [Valsa mali]
MHFSTRPALAALLMATGVLSKPCGKGAKFEHFPTTLSTFVVPATFSVLPPFETSSIVIQPTSTLSSSVVVATPSTTSTPAAAAITTPSSSSSVAVVTPSTTSSSAAAATSTASASSSSLTSDQDKALELQNTARSGVSETALTWDDTLASDALSWAQHLASTYGSAGTLTHSSGTGEGENLYWQSDSETPYTNAATAWVDEKSSYDGEAITGTGNFEDYGHYTQIIWESTTKVGMGIASDGAGGYYVVARYTPEGNVIGETPTSA